MWLAYGADASSAVVNMQPLPSDAYVRYTLSASLPSTIDAALEATSDVRFVDAAEMRPAPNKRRDRAPPSVAAAPASMAADAGMSAQMSRSDRARRPGADDTPEHSSSLPPFACYAALGAAWPLLTPSMAADHGASFQPQPATTSPLSAGEDRLVQVTHAGVDDSGGAPEDVPSAEQTS